MLGRLVTEMVTDLTKKRGFNSSKKDANFCTTQNEPKGLSALRISEKGSKLLNLNPLSGGLFGIDQEVVTLRGLSRQLRGVPDRRP
jgi:hypothetical protein